MEFLNNINWRRGQPIHEIERNLILLNHGRGLTNQEIENEINREVKTVKRWLNRFYTTGMFKTLLKSGRPRKTTPEQDYAIRLAAIENPRITRAETKDQLNIDLSLDYISKRLNEWGLYSRIARIKEALGVGHRAYRLQFAQEFANFDQWDRTVFVDEATFQTGYAVRTIIWRPMGTAFQNQYIVPKAQSERRSISVFGIMSSRGLGPLIRIGGRFDGGNYINILNDTVLPYI